MFAIIPPIIYGGIRLSDLSGYIPTIWDWMLLSVIVALLVLGLVLTCWKVSR